MLKIRKCNKSKSFVKLKCETSHISQTSYNSSQTSEVAFKFSFFCRILLRVKY